MSNRRLSVRSRLLASVMAGFFPATAIAADTHVLSDQSVGQVQLSGSDSLTVEHRGTVVTANAGAVVITGDSTGIVINNGGMIRENGSFGAITLAAGSPPIAGPITINNTFWGQFGALDFGSIVAQSGVAVSLGGATGPVTINNGPGAWLEGQTDAIITGSGDDTFTTHQRVVGAVRMGGGRDTVNLVGGSSSGPHPTWAFGDIYGSEVINVQSGGWNLTGAVDADTVTVGASGTLYIDEIATAGAAVINSPGALNLVADGMISFNRSDTRLNLDADDLHLSGAGGVALSGGGVLQLGQNVSVSNVWASASSLVVTGDNLATAFRVTDGTLRIGAAYSAPDVDGYVTIVAGGGATGSVTGDIENFGSVVFDRSNASTYAGVISGTGSVTKAGTGVLTLSGANTYGGGTTVAGGTLRLASNGAASTGAITTTGSTIDYANGVTISNSIILNSNDTALNVDNGSATQAGVISQTGGARPLEKTGAGTLILTADNTYTGPTTISAGTLQVGNGGMTGSIQGNVVNNAALEFNRSSALTYGGVISGTGSLHKSGAGVLTLTGDNTHTGVTTIEAGTLKLGNGGATGSIEGDIVNNAALVFDRSGLITYAGDISGTGSLTKTAASDGLLLTGTNTYTGLTTVQGGTLQVGLGSSGSLVGDVALQAGALVFGRADNVGYAGAISGAGSLMKTGPGALVFTGTATHTGGTSILQGSTLQIGDGGTAGSLDGAVTNLGALVFNRSDAVTFTGSITGAGSTTKLGTNTLTIDGNLNSSGGIAISGGTLQIGNGGTTGSFSGDVTNNGILQFNRSTAYTYGGVISGAGALHKTGGGTLTLVADQGYTGGTTISGGVLQVGTGGASGSIVGDVVNNGYLIFNRSGVLTYDGAISGTGGVTKNGGGLLQLGGANSYTGGTNLVQGGLIVSGSVVGLTTLWSGTNLEVISTGSARFVNGDGVTVTNAGTIETPLVTTGSAPTINLGNAGNTLNNSGVIRSYNGNAVRFGSGADTLNLSTGSAITGSVFMGGGFDSVNLAGSLSAKSTSQAFGDIFQAEILNVNTGYWTLNKELGADTVNVLAGATLELDSVGALPGEGGFVSSSGPVLTVVNNGALIQNTDDTRLDIYADNLHLSGAGTVELKGGGTLQYGQNITLTGATTVSNGTLIVTGDNIASPINVAAQGTLRIGAAYSAPDVDGYVTLVQGGGATGSVTGNIANAGAVIFDRANASTYGGAISGAGSLTKTGAGMLTLSGVNTHTGGTAVTGGGLTISGSVIGLTTLASGTTLDITSTGSARVIAGDGVTVTNAGTIDTPLLTTGTTASVNLGNAGNTLTNSGVIRSYNGHAMRFGSGNDTLNLETGSTITGRVDMGAGSDVVNLSGSSPNGSAQQVVGNIFGSDTLNVNMGYWTLNREVEADQVNIAAGATLDIDSYGAAPGDGGFISSHGAALTIVNNGAAIVSTDDTRLDIYADDLHLSGAGTLELRGGGSIQLGQNFTQTGATTISSGMIVVTGDNIASPITVASQGTLRVGAAFSAPDVDGYVNIIAGGGTTGWVAGNIANSGAVIFDRANASTYGGVMSGTGAVTKSGAGVLTLSGANTYTGATTVNGGGLLVSAPFASSGVSLASGTNLSFTGPNALTYAGAVTGAGSLAKTGTGVLTLSGVSTHTGGTTVSAGALTLTGSLIGLTTLTSGTRLDITSTGSARVINGDGVLVTNAGTIDTPLLTMGSLASVTFGNSGGNLTNSGVIRSYNGNAVRFGSGADVLYLGTGSAITGSVFMGGGTDAVNLNGSLNTKSTSQVFGDIFQAETVNVNAGYWTLNKELGADTVNVLAGATLELDSVGALPGEGGFVSSSGPVLTVVNNGALIQNTDDTRLDIYADNLHIGGSGTLELKGGGTLQYGANVALTGATTVSNGTLIVTGENIASPISVAAQGTLRIGAAYSAPDVDGYVTLASGGGTTGSVASNIANNGAVIFDRSNASTYAGVMSGSGSVTKSGAGVLTLSGGNTYTGATTVGGGGLVVSGPLASSGVSLASGTGLTFTGSNALTYAGVVSGAGGLTKTGSGVVTLSGANSYTGSTTVSAGGLTVTGSIASQAVSVGDGATFTFGSAANQTFGGVVSGAGSLGKSGAGTLTLTGANTYTGATTVSGGTLVLSNVLGSDVTVAAGGTLQIGTGGTVGSLTGDLAANGAVIFNRSDDYVYAGDFSGNGSLTKRGAGLLTLDGLYTFSGTTTIEAGTIKITQLDAGGSLVVGSGSTVDLSGSNQTVGGLSGGSGSSVNIEDATLTINQTPSTTPTVFNGALTGDGALILSGGGILDLAGTNSYTGPTTVNGGTLKVNGSITSPVTVNNGGSLGGSGVINGAVTIGSGGTISPGNSPGVQTIAGPLTLAAGSTLVVEVDPTATITNDRINVTAGAATIAAGANLSVQPLGAIANYDRVNDYVILTASGGVNGTFGANVTSTMALLTPSVSYTANQVSLRLIRNDISFASLAQTGNQAAVAAAAEGTGPSGAAYTSLVGQDAAGARAGYDALSGELYGAAASLVIDESRHQRAALLKQAASNGAGAWARLHTGDATIDATAGSAEASNRSFSLAGGGQVESSGWNLGFGLAYGQSDIEVAARASASEVTTFRAGVYGGTEYGAWRVRFGADAAKHEFDASRGIAFPTVSQSVTADYDGSSRQVFGEVAYVMDVAGGSLEPFAELAAVWAKTDSFNEAGGTLGLSVAEQDRSLTFATIGARFNGAWDMGGGSVRPNLSLAWRRASGDVEGASTAAFGTSSFTVTGAGVAKDTALIDAGVGFDVSETMTGSVSYSGALSSDAKDHAVRAGLSLRF